MNNFNKILSNIKVYFSDLLDNDNILIILNVSIILVTIIVLLDIFNIKLEDSNLNKDKQVKRKVIYFENFKSSNDNLLDKVHNDPLDKHNICKKMTNKTCKMSSFCVLLNNNKCVGGDEFGPTYLTDNNKKVDFQYYTHKNKCYGNCSSKNN